MNIIETSLRSGAGAEALPLDQITRHRQIQLPDGKSCVSVKNL